MTRPTAPAAPLRILIVEDRPLDAELMIVELARAEFASATTLVETPAQFSDQLTALPDVILCDYTLPGFGALEALRLVRERQLDIPFIVVSGSIGEETAVEAIKRGADDYLLKDRLGRLGAAISQAIEEKQLRAAAHRAEEDLRQSEFKYRCLFEYLPDAACLCDGTSGKIIDVNQRGERLLGLDRAAILGLRLGKFVPEAACRSLLAAPDGGAAGPVPQIDSVLAVAARRIPVRISATTVPIYGRRLLLAFFRELAAAGA